MIIAINDLYEVVLFTLFYEYFIVSMFFLQGPSNLNCFDKNYFSRYIFKGKQIFHQYAFSFSTKISRITIMET